MFYHDKKLMFDVKVDGADAQFAQMLLEQFGGATGELSAALTYWTQSFHVEDKAIRDMLHDIAIEEFSHLEMVGRMIEQHTEKGTGAAKDAAYRSTLFAVRGMGPHLVDSQGQAWTSAYVNEGGNVVRDLRADIAAEAGARQTYEALIKLSPDEGSKKALTFLLTREVSHTQMFMKALESLGKLTDPLFGNVRPDETVDLYFNLSKDGALDARGPWNSEPAFRYVDKPEPQGGLPAEVRNPDDERGRADPGRQAGGPARGGSTPEMNNPAGQQRDPARSAKERTPIK
ncbi:MAG TPA: manganese catalase family protein [Stellaceae bacterium]|jgi:Mn-containing catalase|nr:manganese catalase family protein [Stellaceae bacterium]